jgi:hypothetical protein
VSPLHRRYLLLDQGLGPAIFNLVVNALIAWGLFRGLAMVPLWGQQSIAGDTVATSFILPLLTCLIVTPIARHHVAHGKVTALGWTRVSHPVLDWLPAGTFWRALGFGVLCAATVGPAAVLVLLVLDVSGLAFGPFVIFKAAYAAILAALVTPVIAACAIAEGAGERS